jgi:hypothetical protein
MTGCTLIAGIDLGTLFAVQGFRQNAGSGGLTDPSGSSEQKSVSHPILRDTILQGLGNGTLCNHLLEDLGPPFSRQH